MGKIYRIASRDIYVNVIVSSKLGKRHGKAKSKFVKCMEDANVKLKLHSAACARPCVATLVSHDLALFGNM